jgi:hypothetical protein
MPCYEPRSELDEAMPSRGVFTIWGTAIARTISSTSAHTAWPVPAADSTGPRMPLQDSS